MAAQANIKAVITAEDRASATLRKFGDNVDDAGKKLGRGLAVAAGVAAAGIAALAVSSVKSFQESELAIAQTNAVLKSTGGIAGVTADMVDDLSAALQKSTRYSDEQVREAQNMLLTFTKINKNIFPETTKIVLDMSTALGQDLKSSAIQVGKALQDPILGVTALRRVGVNFSDAQRDVIKRLVETNKAGEAQALILKELQTEFGGSAEAAGKTFAGQLDILNNQFDEMKETLGAAIVPVIGRVVDRILKWIEASGGAEAVINNRVMPVLQRLYDMITNYIIPAIMNVTDWWNRNYNTISSVFSGIVTGINFVIGAFELFINIIKITQQVFIDVTWSIAVMFSNMVISVVGFFDRLVRDFAKMWQGVQRAWDVALNFIKGIPGAIEQALKWVWHVWTAPFSSAFNYIVDLYNKTIGRLLGKKTIEVSGKYATNVSVGQFAEGGFTGRGGANEIAGIVHKGEYVVPQSQVDQSTGMPKMGGAGGVNNFNVNVGIYAGTKMERRQIAMTLFRDFQDVAAQMGISGSQLLDKNNGAIIR